MVRRDVVGGTFAIVLFYFNSGKPIRLPFSFVKRFRLEYGLKISTKRGSTHMPYMLIRHKVKDYTKWKTVFDAHNAMRKSGGEKTYQIFHTGANPKNLVLLF